MALGMVEPAGCCCRCCQVGSMPPHYHAAPPLLLLLLLSGAVTLSFFCRAALQQRYSTALKVAAQAAAALDVFRGPLLRLVAVVTVTVTAPLQMADERDKLLEVSAIKR